MVDKSKLEDIRSRHAAATKGPYKWRWTCGGHRAPELIAPHHGMLLVMDAVRSGMNGAVLRFARRTDSMGGLMFKLTDLLPKRERRCAELIDATGNPDADAMAHSWQDIEDLLEVVDLLLEDSAGSSGLTP